MASARIVTGGRQFWPDGREKEVSQDLITQEQASATFAAGARLSRVTKLTVAHHQALLPLLLRLSATQTPGVDITVGHWKDFKMEIVAGWNSQQRASADPVPPKKKREDAHIHVGTLRVTLPLTKEQIKKGVTVQVKERRAGEPAHFGLTLNYETESILWTWRDENFQGVPADAVRINDHWTPVYFANKWIA
ncbi:hypothetical protein FPHYL_9422 [Fusarium phyllophilum]|uniref:Uncharacterized protein n=1 Tax=Fusarium phyllophilum TaxID=47803 RepID=A0A8H5N388_9HYPO|nr:hypothetical protein FPHYL_9422 [Fusarium phyllophilum]